ncbi:MAG: DUF4365 domain-containing protein [bacterium]|nr:DUF4365 domain-containing protein [bacterium]
MPNMDWKSLSDKSRQKFGAYGEYYAKMEFASYGGDVYTSEVDDHGIDFVCKLKDIFLEIQVKSIQEGTGYVFMPKAHFDINDEQLFVCLLIFKQGSLPNMYLISASAWQNTNDLLRYRAYDKPNQKSKPEYGINISSKNMQYLNEYKFDTVIKKYI